MTKIRSTRSSGISDRRGRGGGRGGFGIPMGGGRGMPGLPVGGGLLGLLVLIAVVVLPQVLGGGDGGGGTGVVGRPTGASPGLNAESGEVACTTEIEQIVCGAVDDVQAYWERQLPASFGVAYRASDTVLFDGAVDTACGRASSETGPFYCPLDEHVYLDLQFLLALEERLVGETADLAEQYIVAHEYGHHVQTVLGTSEQMRAAQRNDPARANQYSIALELQADCYAGAWVGDAAARGLLERPDEIEEALAAAAAVGDDRIQASTQGRVDPESWTHGSAEQRQTWFLRGFQTLDPARCTTFDEIL